MDALTIGRASDNNLVIDNPMVSRYHARLYKLSGYWYLADLQSTHGTRVNGVSVADPVIIKPTDQLSISDISLTFDGEALYSSQGRKLLSLKHPTRETAISAGAYSAVQLPVIKSTQNTGKFNRVVFITLTAVFVLFAIALFTLLKQYDSKQVATNQPAPAEEPQVLTTHATITFDGGEYTGMLLNGLPHGQGTLTYTTSKVTGSPYDVMSGLRSGGKVYEGEWQNGRKHGYGKMINPDGSIDEGYWQNDQFIGQGGN